MMTQKSSGQTLGLRITPSQTQGAKAWCQVARGRLLCRWAGPLFLSFLMSFFSLLRRTVSHLSKEKSIRNPLAASVAFLCFSLQGLWVLGSNCKTVRLEQKLIAKLLAKRVPISFQSLPWPCLPLVELFLQRLNLILHLCLTKLIFCELATVQLKT